MSHHFKRRVAIVAAAAVTGALALGGTAAFAINRIPAITNLSAELSGDAEVPGPGDPDGSGTFIARLDKRTRSLCYQLEVKNIARPTAAQIHVGDRLHSSIIVQPLLPPTEGKSTACVPLFPKLAKHIMIVPQEYYINVYNEEYPNGAIRGQLLK